MEEKPVNASLYAEELKMAGNDVAKQVPALLKLGDWYVRTAKTTGHCADFTKANAIFNAALVRERYLCHETNEEEIFAKIVDTYREFLHTATKNNAVNQEEIRDEVHFHKQFLATERQRFRKCVEDICSHFSPSDKMNVEGKEEVSETRAEKIYEVFRDIQNMYTRLVEMLAQECESRLGEAPCEYAIVALGSVGRMEATPYSDLEFAILYSEPASANKVNYFRVLTHFLHLKIINLGETILPALGIEYLNDFLSSNPSSNWFYDSLTPRGISFDGAMPWASKTPLGRMATQEKPALELIRTPQEMAELQDEDVALKEGYHLADIISRATLLYGNKALLNEYNERVAGKLNAKSLVGGHLAKAKSIQTVGFIRGMKQLLLDTVTYDPCYSYIGKHCTVGALFDAKKQFYRLISLLLSDLGLIFDIRSPSPWHVVSTLRTRGIITDSVMASIKVCLSIANEMRLKTYLANGGQKELLSPLPQYVNSEELQSTDAPNNLTVDPPIFRDFDENILIRLLSTSNEMHRRCHDFCAKYLEHGEIDINVFRNSVVPTSNSTLMGTLYFRLQNFPKAIEWMKSESKESPDYSVSLNGQGIIYSKFGDYEKSIECFENALKLHYEKENISNLNVLSCLNNLAFALMDIGKYQEAKIRFEEAIKKHSDIYGKDYETITLNRLMHNLGLTHHGLGDMKSAIETFEEVQRMQNRLGHEVPDIDIIQVNINLALSLNELEDHAQSLSYVQKALCRSKKIFGDKALSSELARIYINAGTIYEHCNLNDHALSWYKQSLEVLQHVFGDNAHPGTISCLNNLGNFFSRRYKLNIALEYLERAVKEARAVYHGRPHPTVALCLSNLGVALKRGGNPEQALSYFEEAKEIMEQVLGKDHAHPITSDVLNNLGTVYQDLNCPDKALQCYKHVLKINSDIYGEYAAHDAMATVCSNIACVAEELGDLLQAKEYYTKAVDIDRKISSTKNTSPGIVSSLYGLSSICEDLGEEGEALKHLQEAREVARDSGCRDLMVAIVLLKLGDIYTEKKAIDEGKLCYQEAKEIADSLGDDDFSSSLITKFREQLGNFE